MREAAIDAYPLGQMFAEIPKEFSRALLEQIRLTFDTYVAAISPTEQEKSGKRVLFNALNEFVAKALGNRVRMNVVGSTAYDVDSRKSDLDIVLFANCPPANAVLNSIMNYLTASQVRINKNDGWVLKSLQMQLVNSARVPLLMITTDNGLVCDISVNTVNSVRHTEYFKRMLNAHPEKRPLMRLIKYWTKARTLPSMKEGGLPGIVWMVIATTYGSCPAETYLKMIQGPHAALINCNLNSIDAVTPVLGSLLRFFTICGSRGDASRYILSRTDACVGKDPTKIAHRVSMTGEIRGIWDEVVSIEDPAERQTHQHCNAQWMDEKVYLGDGPSKSKETVELLGIKDLATKVSCATWLVYFMELRRGTLLLTRLLAFFDDSKNKVRRLPQMFKPDHSKGLGMRKFASLLKYLSDPTSWDGDARGGEAFIGQIFRHLVSSVFKENFIERYVLPGCDEVLRQMVESEANIHRVPKTDGAILDAEWGADVMTMRGVGRSRTRPFCSCCSISKTDFALVLLHGRVHLLKIDSICTDWSTWWTRAFLCRRDFRSVIHGTLYTLIPSSTYKHVIDTSGYLDVTLPPSCFNSSRLHNRSEYFSRADAPTLPTLVIPVREYDTQIPIEILFHPCHFITRVCAFQTPEYSSLANLNAISKDVYFMNSDEINFISTISSLASEAPWHVLGDHVGLREDIDEIAETFQAPAKTCPRCGVSGASMPEIASISGYVSADGPNQLGVHADRDNYEFLIRDVWRRWDYHCSVSEPNHARAEEDAEIYRNLITSMVKHDIPIVPSMHGASRMIFRAVSQMKRNLKRFSAYNGFVPQYTRCNSAPPTITCTRELANPQTTIHSVMPDFPHHDDPGKFTDSNTPTDKQQEPARRHSEIDSIRDGFKDCDLHNFGAQSQSPHAVLLEAPSAIFPVAVSSPPAGDRSYEIADSGTSPIMDLAATTKCSLINTTQKSTHDESPIVSKQSSLRLHISSCESTSAKLYEESMTGSERCSASQDPICMYPGVAKFDDDSSPEERHKSATTSRRALYAKPPWASIAQTTNYYDRNKRVPSRQGKHLRRTPELSNLARTVLVKHSSTDHQPLRPYPMTPSESSTISCDANAIPRKETRTKRQNTRRGADSESSCFPTVDASM